MTRDQAETAVTASALIVGGIYIYRRLSETQVQVSNAHGLRLKQLAGSGPVLPTGPFITGWGFTFLVIALMAQASPKLGGYMAILVATGAALGNGQTVVNDLNKKLVGGAGASVPLSAGTQPAPPTGQHVYPNTVVKQGTLGHLGYTY